MSGSLFYSIIGNNRSSGFTLIELMVVIAIIGTLSAIAIPSYLSYRDRARMASVIGEFKGIETAAYAFLVDRGRFPDTLAEAGLGNPTDPWGRPYVYRPVAGTPMGLLRKDHALVPINTDFDLYSLGKDGNSQPPLTAAASRDDILRANNGSFIGLGKDY